MQDVLALVAKLLKYCSDANGFQRLQSAPSAVVIRPGCSISPVPPRADGQNHSRVLMRSTPFAIRS